MEITILLVGFLASLAQILQPLIDFSRDLQQRHQDRQRLGRKIQDLRWQYWMLFDAARKLIESLCQDDSWIPDSTHMEEHGRHVATHIEPCMVKLQEIEDLTAVNDEGLICLQTLHRIRLAFHQFIKSIATGSASLMRKTVGTIVSALDETLSELENRYAVVDVQPLVHVPQSQVSIDEARSYQITSHRSHQLRSQQVKVGQAAD